MSVDKFGRSSFHLQQKHGFFEAIHEEEEVVNVKKRRITNLEAPIKNTDAANKFYVDNKVSQQEISVYDIISNDYLTPIFIKEKQKLVEIVENYKMDEASEETTLENQPLDSQEQKIILTLHALFLKWLKTM
jgi:hypothetical protein